MRRLKVNIGQHALPSRVRIGGELGLVQFDQVFGLAPGAVEGLIDVLGRTGVDAGDDEADIEPLSAPTLAYEPPSWQSQSAGTFVP